MASQLKTKKNRPNPWFGAYSAESTDLCTSGSGVTAKIPPLFDGWTFWFTYNELIHDWLDLTVLEAENEAQR